MEHLPTQFSPYRQVLARLAPECRPSGQAVEMRCPFPDRHKHGDKKPSCRAWIGTRGELVCRCMACRATWSDFVQAAGLPAAAWWPHQEREWIMDAKQPIPVEVARYAYHTRDGELIGWKVRLEPGYHGERKTFVWERPLPVPHAAKLGPTVHAVVRGLKEGVYTPARTKAGKIVYSIQAETTEASIDLPGVDHLLSLYNLPAVATIRPEIPLLVVEGEKVADEMKRLGFRATSGYAGFQKWNFNWGVDFRGRRLVVIPDRDPKDAALSYAYAVAASALYYQAAEVRIMLTPATELPPDGGDVCHWLERRGIPLTDLEARRNAIVNLIKKSDFYVKQ